MHLGNIFTALMSWLSVKSRGGEWLLRIEDLDAARSKPEFIRMIEDDLAWLGLYPDEGGTAGRGSAGPYLQSLREDFYRDALSRLMATGYTYPCSCTRAEILATQAPHQSDGRVIYGGRCRPARLPMHEPWSPKSCRCSVRLAVPDEEIRFCDGICGPQKFNLATECGDFIVRRADGAWAYQLAVVVDDALMGVTEVMRGRDLLLSAAQQIYLYRLLGLDPPEFAHVPLVCNGQGQRLSKRDRSMSMEELRKRYSAEELLGILGAMGGMLSEVRPVDLAELKSCYSPDLLASPTTINADDFIK